MSETQAQLEILAGQPAAVAWFRGLFAMASLEFTDTGEEFTIVQHGDWAEVVAGRHRPDADLVIPLTRENLDRLATMFGDGGMTPAEEYRIVKFMLRPCLEAALRMPILTNSVVLKILRVDDIWHQALVDPEGREDLPLTIEKVDGKWTVTSGYHGHPRRKLRLTAPQLLDFQRRVFEADSQNSLTGWVALATWYTGWRDQVTVPVGT